MDTKLQNEVIEFNTEVGEQQPMIALSDLQLALVGGGSGDVVFA